MTFELDPNDRYLMGSAKSCLVPQHCPSGPVHHLHSVTGSVYYPRKEASYVMVDLDGTLCDTRHREHFIKRAPDFEGDWESYSMACSDDTPIVPVIRLVQMLYGTYPVVIFSGRQEMARTKTVEWLGDNSIPHSMLFMRPDGSRVGNVELKMDWVRQLAEKRWHCAYAIDDHPGVIQALKTDWRVDGLQVHQNGPTDVA